MFQRLIGIIALISVIIFSNCGKYQKQPIDYVNPFIGTSGDHGQLSPAATVPFGMIKLGPDTYPSGLNGRAHAGYNYTDKKIVGFSQVRIDGMGCNGVGGNVLIMPVIGHPGLTPEKYASTYDKSSERASPGFYEVKLTDYNIDVALTATNHVGFHRYIFPASDDAHILIDLGRSYTKVRDAHLEVRGSDEVVGYVVAKQMGSWQDNYTLYFAAKFSKPCTSFSVWNKGVMEIEKREETGKNIGIILNFNTQKREQVFVKVGISNISIRQAQRDRDIEVPEWDFNKTLRNAQKAWREKLNKISIEGKEEFKQIFYSALYRVNLLPFNTTSYDKSYRGTDGKIHMATDYTHYYGFSIWDTYRTKYPLLSIIEPDVFQDVVQSLIDIKMQGEKTRPFLTVNLFPDNSIIVDGYVKGLRNFDAEAAFQKMRYNTPDLSEETFKKCYIPDRPGQTLENCYSDWCIAQMAKALGKEKDYHKFLKRSQCYRNVWDKDVGFFNSRAADGSWAPFTDPTRVVESEAIFYEGSMWQWRWAVPHDIPGLIELFGGKENFIEQLNLFFSKALYNHGNEPDLHAAFLFNIAGAPWLTQKWVHKILAEPMTQRYGTHNFFKSPIYDRIYKATPDGFLLEMDDDCGAMTAWYVLASMGLYQVCPGLPVYQIVSPLFPRITIHLDSRFYKGNIFTIKAHNLSDKNIYIQSVKLNGKPYEKSWITHRDIVNGGEMVFEMGPSPNKKWGINQ